MARKAVASRSSLDGVNCQMPPWSIAPNFEMSDHTLLDDLLSALLLNASARWLALSLTAAPPAAARAARCRSAARSLARSLARDARTRSCVRSWSEACVPLNMSRCSCAMSLASSE
eukprot:6006626-Prymnesium_polylepis.1